MVGENLLSDSNVRDCPYSNKQLGEIFIKTGQALSDNELYAYQVPLAKRIIQSILESDSATITALFSRQCLDPDTLIMTPTGNKKIKDLKIKDKVLTVFNNKVEEDEIQDLWESSVPVSTIEFEDHSTITCSQNHRFFGFKGWTSLADGLKPRDFVKVPTIFQEPTNLDEKISILFALILQFGTQSNSILKEIQSHDLLKVQIANKEFAKKVSEIFRIPLTSSPEGYSFRIPVNLDNFNIKDVFEHRQAVLQSLMESAELIVYSGNRFRKYKIRLTTTSTHAYRDELISLLRQFALCPIISDRFIEFTDFQSMFLLHHFFKRRINYGNFMEFLETYSNRFGHFVSPQDYLRTIETVKGFRGSIKSDSHYVYKNKGMPLTTFIAKLESLGIPRPHVFSLIPNSLFIKINKISSLTMQKTFDLETKTFNSYIANDKLCHNSGKTETISIAVSSMMIWLPQLHFEFPQDERFKKFRHGFWVGIFAPVQDQADTMFSRIKARLTSHNGKQLLQEFGLEAKPKGRQIELSNSSFVFCKPAGEGVNIESKTLHLAIAEECQDLSSYKLRKSINPMCAATGGTMVYIGTSNTRKSFYYESIQFNVNQELTTGTKDHFEVNWEEAAQYNKYYKSFVMKEMEKLGYDSDEFKMSYRNIFIFQRGMMLDNNQLEFFDIKDNPKGLLHDYEIQNEYLGNKTVVIGLDLGKTIDSTVAIAVEVDFMNPIQHEYYTAFRKRLIGWMELLGDDFESQYDQIMDFTRRMKGSVLVVDATGKGEPIFDRLYLTLPHVDVIPFRFSLQSKHLLFKNFISDAGSNRIMIPAGKATIQSREFKRFIVQMADMEKEYKGEYLSCHAPNIKGAHDDYPVAFALACYAAKEERMGNVEVSDNPFY